MNDEKEGKLALFTDLYELTMSAGYFELGYADRTASFELFFRHLPHNRGYLLFAGLEQVLEFLESFSFSDDQIAYLRSIPALESVSKEFFEYLRDLRFTGELWAVEEGIPVFTGEPVIRVTAPIIQAQLVETALLSMINHQTMVATKAARVVQAAEGRGVIDFGARRAHNLDASLWGARAAYIGGCVGTSFVEAGMRFDIPVFGTVAHSFVMFFPDEEEAFQAYAKVFPGNLNLLIDTYDTIAAAHIVKRFGSLLKGVRIDSGDLQAEAKEVRRILDREGLNETKIVLSGDLNEFRIAKLLSAGTPVDLFGVGSEMVTSADAPAMTGVYKLVEVDDRQVQHPRLKLSPNKVTYPGKKQVWRSFDRKAGCYTHDIISTSDEVLEGYIPLLSRVMTEGKALALPIPTRVLREKAGQELARLSPGVRSLTEPAEYEVRISDILEDRYIQETRRITASK